MIKPIAKEEEEAETIIVQLDLFKFSHCKQTTLMTSAIWKAHWNFAGLWPGARCHRKLNFIGKIFTGIHFIIIVYCILKDKMNKFKTD